jgi:hypothetical protein
MKNPGIPDMTEGPCHFCGAPNAYYGRREDGSGRQANTSPRAKSAPASRILNLSNSGV